MSGSARADDNIRPHLLYRLLRVELKCRRRRGSAPRLDIVLGGFPSTKPPFA